MKSLHKIGALRSAIGPGILMLTGISLPIGIAIGILEIGLGLSLQELLAFYNLLSPEAIGFRISSAIGVDPRLLICLLGVLVGLARYGGFVLPLMTSEAFSRRVRAKILMRTVGQADQGAALSSPDVTHLLSNVIPRSVTAINLAVQLLSGTIMCMVLVVGMLKLSPSLTAIALGLEVIAATVLLPAPIFLRRAAKALHENISAFTHRLMKDVQHGYLLRIIGADSQEKVRLLGENNRILSSFLKYYGIQGGISVYPFMIGILLVVIIIETNVRYGLIGLVELVPFVYFLHRFSSAAAQLSNTFGSLIQAVPFFREIFDFLKKTTPLAAIPHSPAGTLRVEKPLISLEVKDLDVGRDSVLIPNLSFAVHKGETFLITGESGCGKTTLLMTLVGLVPPRRGAAKWNGHNIVDLDPGSFRKRISFVGPSPYLFAGTIAENLLFGIDGSDGSDVRNDRIQQALWCSCSEFVNSRPGGIESKIGEDGAGLSAGQQQRLSLARAILRRPDLLLLDEATANIDENMEKKMMERFRATFPETIILSISHRASMRAFATQFLDLN